MSQVIVDASHERDAQIDAQWNDVMRRCEPILPSLTDLRLRLSAAEVARGRGLPNATALERWLVLRRLPPFRRLRPWICMDEMVSRFDDDQTLSHWADEHGYRASVYYRFVARETGHQWNDVKRLGRSWVRRHALNAWSAYLR